MPSIRQRFYLVLTVSLSCGVIVLLNFDPLDVSGQKQRAFFESGHGRLNSVPAIANVTKSSNNNKTVNSVTKALCASNEHITFSDDQRVTIDHFGQLGNNMFQYAGLLGVAGMNNRTPFISPRSLLGGVFKLTHLKQVANTNRWKLVGEPRYAMYDSRYECLPKGPLLLQCYFQSFKYFKDISHVIQREFTFVSNIDKSANRLLSQLPFRHENSTTVGVHIRRGDKLTQKEVRSGERVAPLSYFQKAFQWMRDKHSNVVFIVTTDDMAWTKKSLKGSDVIVLPPAVGPVHLSVLTKCNHVIMSVGTFGWWAGWLAGGDVIYFNQPIDWQSWKGQRFKMDDYYPKHWIGLGA